MPRSQKNWIGEARLRSSATALHPAMALVVDGGWISG